MNYHNQIVLFKLNFGILWLVHIKIFNIIKHLSILLLKLVGLL